MKSIFASILIVFTFQSSGQVLIELDGINWILGGNSKREIYKGEECLNTDDGSATVNNFQFKNGIIEFEMCIQPGRGFAGVRFHENDISTEEFYIRKHQSGNPDAMQYTPVYYGNAGWQLYYGDGYSTAKQHVFNEWFKIKLIISGTKGEAYIDDMENPILVIHELKLGEKKGDISFYGPARFANIKITEIENPQLKGQFKEIVKAGKEVIQRYRVSEIFDAESLLFENMLPANFTKKLEFKEYKTEADGLLNISQTGALGEKKNAVLLKLVIDSETDLIKMMNFGFSDAAKIFINGKAVWLGNDAYSSRDYRFLGTIGYYDAVYLDLKTGKNEVYILVAEGFGGWGFKAEFDNLNGIKIQ